VPLVPHLLNAVRRQKVTRAACWRTPILPCDATGIRICGTP